MTLLPFRHEKTEGGAGWGTVNLLVQESTASKVQTKDQHASAVTLVDAGVFPLNSYFLPLCLDLS